MENNKQNNYGVGIGTVIAAILSFTINKSILYMVLHGICSWGYIIYWALKHAGK